MARNLAKIVETPDMAIVLSDGCRLSARTWMPADADTRPVPAILEYLPYRKRDGTTARDQLTHPWFAERGYACIRVDMRGNGDSEGLMEDEYAEQELTDGVEVINWIAGQPWCAGTVGMMGISWGGFNALQIAALDPAPLKAIITLCSTVDRYADDIHFKGGCLLSENQGWGATMLSYSSRPPDPALVGDNWRAMWLKRLQHQPLLAAKWLSHQTRDDYWRHGSVCEDYSAIKAATLAVGGWGDAYKNAVSQIVENLHAPAKGIVGPWIHKYPHFAVPEPRIGFLQEALRWWDRWLKDVNNGVEDDPAYRVYVMDGVPPKTAYTKRPGRWIAQTDGPHDGVENRVFSLTDTGSLVDGDCHQFERHISSPHHCGIYGGEYCAIWLGPDLPGDQRADDALSACFDTSLFAHAIDIVGAPTVTMAVACDRPNGQLAIRLCDVAPDGTSARITYGVINLTHCDSHQNPTTIEPDLPFALTVKLDHIAYCLAPGHRLRLAISTSYWPLIWPAPETAELTLLEGSLHLPLRATASGDETAFEPPTTAEPWRIEHLRESTNRREIITDMASGTVTVAIEDDFGEQLDLDHGLANGSIAREKWTIDPNDPLSARGETHWTQTLAREKWSVRTETFSVMHADADSFYMTGRIEAYEGDEMLFEKEFSETIARNLV